MRHLISDLYQKVLNQTNSRNNLMENSSFDDRRGREILKNYLSLFARDPQQYGQRHFHLGRLLHTNKSPTTTNIHPTIDRTFNPANQSSCLSSGGGPKLANPSNSTNNLNFVVPFITREDVIMILCQVRRIFESEAIVLDMKPPFYTIGDLHGNILDFMRFLKFGGIPSFTECSPYSSSNHFTPLENTSGESHSPINNLNKTIKGQSYKFKTKQATNHSSQSEEPKETNQNHSNVLKNGIYSDKISLNDGINLDFFDDSQINESINNINSSSENISNIASMKNPKYLFLRDYIDRGEFSLETVIFLFLLKIYFPQNIFIVRGNHEFLDTCRNLSFYCEICSYFNENILYLFTEVFAYMPLAAVVDNYAIFLHGGIGPHFTSLQQISELQRPIYDFNHPVVSEVVWSDPCEEANPFLPSNRGIGTFFGQIAIDKFLEDNGFSIMVRGHQPLMEGCAFSLNHKVATIYGSSNEKGVTKNKCGIAIITEDNNIIFEMFNPIPFLKREDAKFAFVDMNGEKSIKSLQDCGQNNGNKKILDSFLKSKSYYDHKSSIKEMFSMQVTRIILRKPRGTQLDIVKRRESAPSTSI
ncbi:hypothetical protein TRFO_02660 [Tritrichomonas foetus]|uniref:Serine/threonine-protein phosphatase n=1 Tax=Tritrichomonas foetus TaxID=1144522 RepID=A0A1J4L384_9EUKA|nr:hypothetical protein TRFO_02660 [Tritrichomonas foetus]|eukprot:OHT16414.1 hypothetical protein TRFO_02660 [Tritrichomonas foetus]